MSEASIDFSEELKTACEKFANIVVPAVSDYKRYPSAVSMGVNRLYANLGTGIMTLECDANQFIKFLECLCSFEKITHISSLASQGITLKHPQHSLEQRILKLRFGDLDIFKVLNHNINCNPDMKRLCEASKHGFNESMIIQKYDNFRSDSLGSYRKPFIKPAPPTRPWRDVLPPPSGFER